MFESLIIKTSRRIEMIEITEEIENIIARNNIKNGICCLFVPHTTAGITINENADPTVKMDINSKLSSLIPQDENYSHLEGNSDAHIKSILVGQSVNIIIDGGKPALGTWQGIYFCEFDGPGNRKIFIKLIKG